VTGTALWMWLYRRNYEFLLLFFDLAQGFYLVMCMTFLPTLPCHTYEVECTMASPNDYRPDRAVECDAARKQVPLAYEARTAVVNLIKGLTLCQCHEFGDQG
jgi:hypothetical protein